MEGVFLEEVEDRDLAFLLLVARGRRERLVVEHYGLQAVRLAVVGHGVRE
jgi:hypothetical protein